jgi:hypothetical protein
MSKLFVASIVLPKAGNAGEDLTAAHSFIKRELCRAFGGFTALDSFGGWIDPESGVEYLEAGVTYQTGMAATPENETALRSIAYRAGLMAEQLAMAVTLPSGEFVILTMEGEKESSNA